MHIVSVILPIRPCGPPRTTSQRSHTDNRHRKGRENTSGKIRNVKNSVRPPTCNERPRSRSIRQPGKVDKRNKQERNDRQHEEKTPHAFYQEQGKMSRGPSHSLRGFAKDVLKKNSVGKRRYHLNAQFANKRIFHPRSWIDV